MNATPWIILFNVILTTFFAIFSATLTIVADAVIQGELAMSDSLVSWVSILYFLGANTSVPGANRLAEIYGFKRIYIIGTLLFGIGSMIAGLAESFPVLAGARYLEGFGSGLIFPIGIALIAQNFPKERLALALNIYFSLAFGLGLGLGMSLSGYFSQYSSWRIPFFIMLPCGLLAAFVSWRTQTETPRQKLPFDTWGLFSFALFVSALIVALANGQLSSTPSGWTEPYILASFALSAIGFVSFLFIERRHPDPIFPLQVFKNPIFSLCCVSLYLMGMAIFASLSISANYLINGLGTEKYMTGLICMIYGIMVPIGGLLSGRFSRFLPPACLTLIGLSGLTASYFWNNILSMQTGWREVMPLLVLRGLSIGFALSPTMAQALGQVPPALTSAAATILTFFRQVGGTYGGTMITIIMIRRKIFYAARWGEQISDQFPGYQKTFFNLTNFSTADPHAMSPAQAKAFIVGVVETQAYIQGLNDAVLVFGYVTAGVTGILLLLNLRQWWMHRKAIPAVQDPV